MIKVGTGVTCPIIRTHPSIIAQAAATTAALFEDRFMLGIGTGENLNEHITGQGWPPIKIRQEMLIEAIEILCLLWQGGYQSYYGEYFVVEKARIYSLPKKNPPILMAASGKVSAGIAGEIADGLISTSPEKTIIQNFEEKGGKGKPKYGQITVCYESDEQEAIKTATKYWPTAALQGNLSQELRTPEDFEAAIAVDEKSETQNPSSRYYFIKRDEIGE